MSIPFYKYHGTGNDFILIDNRNNIFGSHNAAFISGLCHRRFGIGADGLILLNKKTAYDFEMIYFNSDGNQSTMCGNGGRCLVAFAQKLGIIVKTAYFSAIDGAHEAIIISSNEKETIVKLKMVSVGKVKKNNFSWSLNTGSPHYVQYVEKVEDYDVFNKGKEIRCSQAFKPDGTNVNFIEQYKDYLFVRTYERGVEDETLSCGSGVTASALVAAIKNNLPDKESQLSVRTLGGFLKVYFRKISDDIFEDIWLEGPATIVYQGEIN